MVNPFWNYQEHRPRALIRIFIQNVILGLILICFELFFFLINEFGNLETSGASSSDGFGFQQILAGLSTILTLIGFLISVFVAGKWLDHRTFTGFGFNFNRRWWGDLVFGLILGAVLMLIIFFIELSMGWIHITGFYLTQEPRLGFSLGILQNTILFICVGIYEELYIRGYLLLNLAEGFHFSRIGHRRSILIATLVSSLVFSALHVLNPGTSWMSILNLFMAGIFLASGYILTGELAIPIGIHITWNFFQGAVFGFPVSGTQVQNPIFSIQQSGPAQWTGGTFGPEAGFLALLILIFGTVLIYLWTTRKGENAFL